jgi:hypothetical protein
MKRLKNILLLLAFGTMLAGCPEDGGVVLTFINQSDQDLFIYTRDHKTEKSLQSDTLLPLHKLGAPVLRYTDKPSRQNVADLYFEDSVYAISVFVMSLDTVRKYPWDIIRDKYMVLKRYDIRRSEEEKMSSLIYK